MNRTCILKTMLALWLCCIVSQTHAAVILSLTASGDTNINVGPPNSSVSIDVYVRQGAGADQIFAAFADFDFGAGTLVSNSGIVAATGADNGSGYLGAGNLNLSTLFIRSASSLEINQEFNNPQFAPTTAQKWFSVQLNTLGLNEGTYNISLRSNPAGNFFNETAAVIPVQSGLTFTVTAIPEPASIVVLSTAAAVGLRNLTMRRRRTC